MTVEQIQEIEIASIRGNNLRDQLDHEALKGLAESVQAVGQIYPVRVRRSGDTFVLVDGHRRTAAIRALGRPTVVAIIEEDSLTEIAACQKALIANAQREDVSPLATAKAIGKLIQKTGWNASETAARLGFPASKITKYLAYLKLPAELAAQLSAQGIGASVAYELARIEDPARQAAQAAQVLAGKLTRDAIQPTSPTPPTDEASSRSPRVSRVNISFDGRVVSVRASELTLEQLVETLQQALRSARRAQSQGLDLSEFVRTQKRVRRAK